MSNERVRVTLAADGVAEVALARPDKMNALDPAMFDALIAALERLRTQAGLRAVVLHGEGRAFCAGLDKSSLEGLAGGGGGIGNIAERTHGVAFGGGLQVALGADIRCVHPDAQLSVMEIKWGLVPDMAGCVLMGELVRPDVARELTFTGRVVSGREAQVLGLATRVSEEPLAEARRIAAQIAAASPDAIRAGKRLFNAASPVDAARVLLHEAFEQQRLIGSANQREAVQAGLEKRPARFTQAGLP